MEGYVIGSYVLNASIKLYDLNHNILSNTLSDSTYAFYKLEAVLNTNISHAYVEASLGSIKYETGRIVNNSFKLVSYVNLSNFTEDNYSPINNFTILDTIKSKYISIKLNEPDTNIISASDIDVIINEAETKILNWLNTVVKNDFLFESDTNIVFTSSQLDIDYVREKDIIASLFNHKISSIITIINAYQKANISNRFNNVLLGACIHTCACTTYAHRPPGLMVFYFLFEEIVRNYINI